MPDVFDQVAEQTAPAGDVFDQVAAGGEHSQRDVFDQVTGTDNGEHAQLRSAPAMGVTERIRRAMSPLTGPTESQQAEEGMTITGPDGTLQRVYKPMGSAVEREGLFPALSHPAVAIPKAPAAPGDGLAMAAGKAIYNTAAGFGEFLESPLGVATSGVGALSGLVKGTVPITKAAIEAARLTGNAQRAVAAGYALDMGSKVPEQATQAGTTSVTGNPQQQIEADLGLGVGVVLPGVLGAHVVPRAPMTPIVREERPGAPVDPNAPVSEFGGESQVGPLADLNKRTFELADRRAVAPATTRTDVFDAVMPEPAKPAVQTSAPTDATPSPAEPATVTQLADGVRYPTVELPVKDLKLSEDVPNFKADADADTGVVAGQQLEGNYERLGTGAITVYERLNGDQEVISGRHRFDLAKRTGEETVPSQIVREADGFTPKMAMTLDAEMNIRDGQGSTGDYANYFRNSEINEADARARGLLSRAKGQAGWALGKDAGDDLYALYRAGKVNEGQAVAIAKAAPGEEALQRVGSKAALNGASAPELANFIQAVRLKTKHLAPSQLDLFGSDDAAMNEAQRLARTATEIQRGLDKEIRSTDNAARNADAAKAKGISFDRDPQAILLDNAKLRVLRDDWNNWALHPELVKQVLGKEGIEAEPIPAEAGAVEPVATSAPAKTLDEKLQSLKFNTQGMLMESVTGMPVHIWNASIDVIRLSVKAGKVLSAAIDDTIEWIKKHYPEAGFDEAEYRNAVMEQYGLREFGQKLQDDADVSPQVKDQVGEYVYQRRTNEADVQTVQRAIASVGIDRAIADFKNEEVNMPGAVRSVLGKTLIRMLGDQERLARGKGDTAAADALVTKQVEVIDHDLKRSTDVAQSLQAMNTYGQMSPAGLLGHARKIFSDASDRAMRTIRPVTELIRRGFQEANQRAVNETVRDPEVNGAARAAVNEQIEHSPEVKRGIVAEITGALSQSPEVMRQIKAQLGGQLDRILKTPPESLARRSKAELGAIFDDLAKRAAGIAAGHYQGAELGKTLAEKLQQRLGLEEGVSKRLADSLDKQFGKMVAEAQAKIPQRIATQRAKQGTPFDPNEVNQPAMDREIRRQLRAANVRLGDLVKQHSSAVDAQGRSIGQRVVADAGLTGPRADALQSAFDKRFAELATAAKQTLVNQLLKQGVKIPAKVRSAIGDLIRLTNIGAFDDAKFYDALQKKMDLPALSPELAKEILRRANELQQLPEGFQRDRASAQLLNFIGQQRKLKIAELGMSMWYANVLSGFTTPVHIMIDNLDQLAGNTLVALVRQPGAIGEAVPALARGVAKGALQAGEIMKSGIVTGVNSTVHTSQALELNPFHGPLAALNYWKYVGRTLSATHVLMFKPAMELKQALVARDVARSEGLRGPAAQQRVADILGNTDAKVTAAQAQAAAEGLSGLDQRRRVGEILEQGRETASPGITETGREYALRSTYLNDPYGVLGNVVKSLNTMIQGIGADHSKLGFIPKMLVPFTRIVGNIINEKLNWSPVGAFRAMRGMQSGELYGAPIADGRAVGDLFTKSILGTAAVTALTTAAAQYLNDEDPKFAITGNGPASPAARKQLQAAGWRPHAIKLGDRYFDYLRTPMAIPLAVVGNYLDATRYRHFDQTDALNRVTFVMKGTADIIVHQSFLDSVAKLFESVGQENTKTGGEQLARTLARAGSSFVVPNLTLQIDRAFDPTRYDDTDIASMVRAQVPFIRRMNKPAINVLGEPVVFGVFDRDYGVAKADPLWRTLTEKQAWIPEPSRETIVGDKSRGPDHYRTMTPAELYDYTQESGARIRTRLEAKLDKLDGMDTMQAKKLVQQITDEQRRKVLKSFSP